MRLIKMIGLAAVAAMAAMAFVGASTASAESTALCSVDTVVNGVTNECPEANRFKTVHEVDPKGVLLSSIVNVHCEVLFSGTIASPWLATAPAGLHITGNFTYKNCLTKDNDPCTAEELNGPALIKVLRLGTEHADVTGEGEVLVDCDPFIHCIYNGTGLAGLALGPLVSSPNGTTHIVDKTVNKVKGFLCPSTAKLDLLTSPLLTTFISR